MKLHVTGVETIEVTDPQGLSNQLVGPPSKPPQQEGTRPMSPPPLAPKIGIPSWQKKLTPKFQPGFTGDPPLVTQLPTYDEGSNLDSEKWTRGMTAAGREEKTKW